MFRLKRYSGNPILKPDKKKFWEASAVFNCSVIRDGENFHMLYRALPANIEPFELRLGKTGYRNFISYIGYAQSNDGITWRKRSRPFIKPDKVYDKYGCEDPRVTKIGDTFYILYTAIDRPLYGGIRAKPMIALASTKDFKKIKKYGVVGPDIRSKAAALFPEKINGKIAMLLTVSSDSPLSSIGIAYFKNEKQLMRPPKGYWEKFLKTLKPNLVLKAPRGAGRGPEVGAVPIKTDKGWLLIYCGEDYRPGGKKEWSISAALLDLKNPQKIIAKSRRPILQPQKPYELKGIVPNVTFPEGAVIKDDELYVYYGGADKVCCLATCNLKKLLNYLK